MIPVYELIILSLASGRIAYSLTQDEIFRPLREVVWRESAPAHATDSEGVQWRKIQAFKSTQEERERWPFIGKWQYEIMEGSARKPGWLGQLVECFYCMSFYTSILAIGAYWIAPDSTVLVATPFAVWGIANYFAKELH